MKRVLLVDDEPALFGCLRRLIRRDDSESTVVYASHPDIAIWQLHTTTVDLVITDLRMHGDEAAGARVIECARALGIPAILLTGAADEVPSLAAPVVRKDEHALMELSAAVRAVGSDLTTAKAS